jgi:hypothetical protein
MNAMRARLFILALAIGGFGLLAVMPLSAHHSIAAQFDINKPPATIVGTITKMAWTNPHGWLYIAVKNEQGQAEQWAIELGGVNALYRRGWRRTDLPIGETVTVTGHVSRDGSHTLGGISIKLPDGRTLFAGQNPDAGR